MSRRPGIRERAADTRGRELTVLVLTLGSREAISIDTPEGVVRITARPPPRFFHVGLCEGQSLRVVLATEEELLQWGGARKWIEVDSAAGRIRIRRFHRKGHSPAPAAEAGRPPAQQADGDGTSCAADASGPVRSRIAIDAPRYMAVWREKTAPDGATPPARTKADQKGRGDSS